MLESENHQKEMSTIRGMSFKQTLNDVIEEPERKMSIKHATDALRPSAKSFNAESNQQKRPV